MTTLLLVRHGETVDNVRQIMQGQTQGELTPNGIEQARALAAELKTRPSTCSCRATLSALSTRV